MKMKDLHINMNLSPTSNGYSRAKGKLYGHVHMEEEVAAMYQEPYKGPIHNPGYYTLNRAATPSETPLKALADTDDSVDYAVPDVNMTPPPPFSEVYTPPPPVPLSRPPNSLPGRIIRETPPPPPVPSIPPPPEQQYYIAPRLCQPSNIQGVTGTVIYSVVDTSVIQKEVPVPEIPRHRIRVLENLGEGLFGTVQLCEVDGVAGQHGGGSLSTSSGNTRLVALKSLKPNASEMAKEDFKSEVRVLSRLEDPNIVMLLGVVTRHEPMAMLLEYMEHGDLYQFLRRHVSEGIAVRHPMIQNPNGAPPPILTYGALIYMGTQIASGMKYLEELNFVHRDLAARNCLVGRGLTIKISDFGMSRPLYSSDYYRIEGRAVLPIRWMAWESVLQGRFTTKSDVWAFGVTLWEILTMARRQAYDELSDEGVLENVSHCYHGDGSGMILLPMPQLCPREMYDMLTACWRPNERQRPPFWEIHMFLQRKNLGYSLDYDD
ncbi:Discoidin domain-containing receptor 2 [Armadillidium vulgare]|nr:Discoidin domain-containing receptor 2 [Armadillidium vulgare]